MGGVGAARPRRLRPTRAFGHRVLDPGMGEKRADCRAPGLAVVGVGIEIAGDDEKIARPEPAALSPVVDQPIHPLDEAQKQADFIRIPPPVEILRPVEDRRRRVAGEDMQNHIARQGDRHIPLADRAEPQIAPHRIGMIGCPIRIHRPVRARQIGPAESPETAQAVVVDGITAHQRHRVLAREPPVAEGVARAPPIAVAVEIMARGQPGIDRALIEEGVVQPL